ncbi:hypothetical protein SAMN05216388_10099 [Halorientalis persicus]|uniref:Uncharacterized protein n=2 Tax=Halorientalis persicus TaxID=1367881 RepID=A0A1H8MIJ1_9EURY|nr:hypothetical protein SAMN05216388_10099 [Halorientalis persicus]
MAILRAKADRLTVAFGEKIIAGILLVHLYAGPALAQSGGGPLCSGAENSGGGQALAGLMNTFFQLAFSIGALGVAVTFFGTTLGMSFSFLSQDQEENLKRARKKAFGSFGMLFIGAIAISVGINQLNILGCINPVPFS